MHVNSEIFIPDKFWFNAQAPNHGTTTAFNVLIWFISQLKLIQQGKNIPNYNKARIQTTTGTIKGLKELGQLWSCIKSLDEQIGVWNPRKEHLQLESWGREFHRIQSISKKTLWYVKFPDFQLTLTIQGFLVSTVDSFFSFVHICRGIDSILVDVL